MAIQLIIGLGISAFLLIYFVFQLDRKEHMALLVLTSFVFLGLVLLIPKAIIDDVNTCSNVVANETTVGNITHYEYKEFCVVTTSQTHNIFYKTIMWYFRVYGIYVFVYLNYAIWLKNKLLEVGIIKKKKEEK